jgi:hypothetical protein
MVSTKSAPPAVTELGVRLAMVGVCAGAANADANVRAADKIRGNHWANERLLCIGLPWGVEISSFSQPIRSFL